MSDSSGNPPFPRAPLVGVAVLLIASLGLVALSRMTGIGVTKLPPAAATIERQLRFEDRADGSVAVIDAKADRVADILEPGTNGFVRGVLRGFARERKAAGVSQSPPFRLARLTDGRILIEDPSTGRRIELDAFGPTNVAAFSRLLTVTRNNP